MNSHMGRFALLCQAARLLGQVLHHVSSDSASNDDVWIQLDRTLQSMVAASLSVDLPDYDQIAFVYRYVLLLVLARSYLSNYLIIALLLLCMRRGFTPTVQAQLTRAVSSAQELSYSKLPRGLIRT